ncbi:sulfotransferase family protein [Propionicimonas sp.]|uniref:sulfotransferase family protein n=1 Tax=Propionicimonas sp. TaxID=1955623 RepID=UPI0039E5592B
MLSTLNSISPQWIKNLANSTTRGWAWLSAGDRPLPDYLIIGCKRGGTTSLFNYLVDHPGVLRMYPLSRGLKSTDFFFKRAGHTVRWYRSHFPSETYRRRLAGQLGYRPVSGEASPYYVWDPRVAARVKSVAPQAKCILLLRDPVKRAWSHYQERRENNTEPLSFAQAIDAEDARLDGELDRMLADPEYYSEAWDFFSYRQRGVYAPQIRTWLEHFPREQLLVIYAEDLYRKTEETFGEVCDFLGIPRARMATTQGYNSMPGSKDKPPQDVVDALRDFYRPQVAELEELVGRPAPWTL